MLPAFLIDVLEPFTGQCRVQHQTSLFAYLDNFRVLGLLALVCVPRVLLFRGGRRRAGAEPAVIG